METKIYMVGSHSDIRIIEKLLEFFNKDEIFSEKIKLGDFKLTNLGASYKYNEEHNGIKNNVVQNAKKLSEEIGDLDAKSNANKIGIIFCDSIVPAANYSAIYPNLIIGFPRNPRDAKAMRMGYGVNVLPFSSEYFYCPNPILRVLRERNLFRIVKAFILAEPSLSKDIYMNKFCIMYSERSKE
jgi:hypothetical protein